MSLARWIFLRWRRATDFNLQAAAGYLVDSGFVSAHPEIFNPQNIPQTLSGEPFYDAPGRWIGSVVSSFGIVYNTDSLARLGIKQPPTRWGRSWRAGIFSRDRARQSNAKQFGQQIVRDAHSAADASRAVETRRTDNGGPLSPDQEMEGRARGLDAGHATPHAWIGANARYFTNASTKIAIDVGAGESGGRYGHRLLRPLSKRVGGERPTAHRTCNMSTPRAARPSASIRSAFFAARPTRTCAREFIAFVMSIEGQEAVELESRRARRSSALCSFAGSRAAAALRAGVQAAAQRSRRSIHTNSAKTFTYHEKWSAPLFRSIALHLSRRCASTRIDELTEAWQALIAAGLSARGAGWLSRK